MSAPTTGRRRQAGRRGALGSPRPARSGTDGRIRLLRFAFLVFLVLVGGKAVALASSSEHLVKYAVNQQTHDVVLPAPRGSILDRNGDELAVGRPQQTVFATPYLLTDPIGAADELCDALQINRRSERRVVEKALVWGKKHHKGFAYVARKVDPEYAKAALKLGIPGVGSYEEEERTYPLKGTAAQVVGYAGMENKGVGGMELIYDKELSGKPGSETDRPRSGRAHPQDDQSEAAASQARTSVLTLDGQIQYTAEKVLQKTLRDTGGKCCHLHRHGPAQRRDPRAWPTSPTRAIHGFGKDDGCRQEPLRHRLLRTRLDLQARHHLRRARRWDHQARPRSSALSADSLQVADREVNESHPHGFVKLQRARDPAVVEQRRRRHDRQEDGQGGHGTSGSRLSASAGRPASSSPVRVGGLVSSGEGLVGFLDRQYSHGTGHRRDGPADGVRVLRPSRTTVGRCKPRLVKQVGQTVYYPAPADKHRVIPAKVAAAGAQLCSASAVDEGTGTAGADPAATRWPARPAPPRSRCPTAEATPQNVYTASFVGMAPADHPQAGRALSPSSGRRSSAARPRRRRSSRSCSTRSSTWRSRREREPGRRERGPGRSVRMRADEAE